MDKFEWLRLISRIIKNFANSDIDEPYSGSEFHEEDFKEFNPLEYERIIQQIGDAPNFSLMEYHSGKEFLVDAMEELFNYIK